MMYESIVFDLDGTLYDNRRLPLRLVLGDVKHAVTLAAERKARRALMGRDYGTAEAFRAAFFGEIARRRGKRVEQIADWYDNSYMPLMVAVLQMYYEARPCVAEVLESLRRRGVRTVVYSDYGCVEAKLRALGIEPDWFDALADAPSLGGLKPSGEVAHRLVDKLGLQASLTLFVGDRDDTDGATARAVGAAFVNVKARQQWDAFVTEHL